MSKLQLRARGGIPPLPGIAVNFGAKTRQGYGGYPTAEAATTNLTGTYGSFFKIDEASNLVPAASSAFTWGTAWTPPVASGTVTVTGASGQVYNITIVANAAHIRERTGRSSNPDAPNPTNRSELGNMVGTTPVWLAGGDTIWCRDGHFNPTQGANFMAPRTVANFGGRITVRSETVDATVDAYGYKNRLHGYKIGGYGFAGASAGVCPIDWYQVAFYLNQPQGPNSGMFFVNVGQPAQTAMTWDECGFWTGPFMRNPVALGTNPLATTNGSGTVTVTHTAHGYTTGWAITIAGATATNGLLAANINGLRTITVIDPNTYSFTSAGGLTATSTGTGGGSAVTAVPGINNSGIANAWGGWSVTNSTIDGTATFFVTAANTADHVIKNNFVRHIRNGDFVQSGNSSTNITLEDNIAFDGKPDDGISHCDFYQTLGLMDGSTTKSLGSIQRNICVDWDGQFLFMPGSSNSSSYASGTVRNNLGCVTNANNILALAVNNVLIEFNTSLMPEASSGNSRIGIGSEVNATGTNGTLNKNVANSYSITVQQPQLGTVTQTGNITVTPKTTAAYQALFPGYLATVTDYSLAGLKAQGLPSAGTYAGALAGAGALKSDGSWNS